MNKSLICSEDIKNQIHDYAAELIHIQKLTYQDYELRINHHLSAVKIGLVEGQVKHSLKDAFISALNEILSRKFYNKTKKERNERNNIAIRKRIKR